MNSDNPQEFKVLIDSFSIWLFCTIYLIILYKMEIYKKPNPISEENAPVISVTVDINEESTDIWNNCISSEFPITYIDIGENEAICLIGGHHQGYTIEASQKNVKLNGEAFLYDYDHRVVASFTYQEGEENGKCKLYYRSGEIYFSGLLHKGYRNGPGVEYSKDGSPIYEGFYKNGRRALNIKQRSDGSNYWEEKDEDGKMVSLFQIDDNGLNHGTCYFYCDGEISKISRWEHGYETKLLNIFDGHIMKIYENGSSIYYGEYRKKSDFEYVPFYLTEPLTESNFQKFKKKHRKGMSNASMWFQKIRIIILFCIVGIMVVNFLLLLLFIYMDEIPEIFKDYLIKSTVIFLVLSLLLCCI